MNDDFLSKLINLSLSTDTPSDAPSKDTLPPQTLPTDSILPSFLLKDLPDDQAPNDDNASSPESSSASQDNPEPSMPKRLHAPPRSLHAPVHKFYSVDNTRSLTQQVVADANAYPSYGMGGYTQSQMQLFPPNRSQLSMNGFSHNVNYSMNYGIQTPQANANAYSLYNAQQFNYAQSHSFHNVNTQNASASVMRHNMHQQSQMPIQRINSFNMVDNVNMMSRPVLHSPTKNQSQTHFQLSRGYMGQQFASGNMTGDIDANAYDGMGNGNVLNMKKVSNSISPSKKSKKKVQKKNTADTDSISISTLLKFPEGELYSFIITQKGSREVQNILKKVTENEVDLLISKLSSHFSDIMIDKYGNYFSQRLIQICSPNQRVEILKSIKTRFTEIAINSFGTHPLQSLIEIVNMPKEREILLHCIEGHELELSIDSKGTHVIQKFILCSSESERSNVDMNILNHLPKLINDSFGVCVLIKLIKHSSNNIIKETIAKYISDNNALSFIQNPYANYVVQALFNQNDIYLCNEIINTIVDHFFSLSMQKFSSNVVENCIRYSDEVYVKKIYRDILSTGKLGSMLNNTYGNFVIEKLIGRLTKEEKGEMIKEITKLGKEKNLSNTIMNLLYK